MKSKILKISIILLLIVTMTMVNFIYIGKTFVSYAIDDISTNVKNIEFGVYFKDENGQKVTQMKPTQMEANMVLQIAVKQDGYFNGQIDLGKANFKIKELVETNEFVNKIEGNTITLNQINAGTTVEIEIKTELLKTEIFDSSLFDMESQINLKGIYKDSTEKDTSVAATKNVKLSYPSANIEEKNIISEMELITNKNIKIEGEDKKVLQIALKVGLKDNSTPIKEITVENTAIKANSNVETKCSAHMNMMTKWESHTKANKISIKLTNDAQDGKIIWKDNGNEEIILTYITKKEATIENQEISANVKMTLFDGQEVNREIKTNIDTSKELNNTITTAIENKETQMYKGKIYQGIDREISTKTKVYVDLAKAHEYLEIKEDNVFEETQNANIIYKSSKLNKERWMKILGEEGKITVINKNKEIVATIDKNTQTDENGNVNIEYGQGQEGIILKTTTPISTGKIEITHNKILKNNTNLNLKEATKFSTIAYVTSNLISDKKIEKDNRNIAVMELREPKTEAKLEINKESLSTAIENNMEMKVVLKTNNESNDLYKNPNIVITLPEDVEKIDLAKVEMLYEEEMKIKSYKVEGRNIIIEIEGEQTRYKTDTVEGANIIIFANITLNQKAATKNSNIQMSYTNQKASQKIENVEVPIKVVAPTEITTIYQIPDLGIQTMGQEENKIATLPVGKEAKQVETYIEIINNKPENINNVAILGMFPTANSKNTINTTIIEGIKIQGIENAKIYYTENENATPDLNNPENGWGESIQDTGKVKKYLITINEMASQTRMTATYKTQILENLEYSQTANQWYEVYYTDSQTQSQNKITSTQIEMKTGVGPKIETSLSAKVGPDNLKNGDKVKAGEVIQYSIEVANTGSEEMKDVKISAQIPEGTTYVEPKENYEYTGSSYYQEINKENFETAIENIKPGEKVVKTYEVRVNKDKTQGQVKQKALITVGDLTKETEELQLIAESGNIRISVKRITDRNNTLYSGSSLEYYAIIENITDKNISNVKIETQMPEELNVQNVSLITGLKEKEITDSDLTDPNSNEASPVDEKANEIAQDNLDIKDMEYNKTLNVGEIKAGETKVLYYETNVNSLKEQKTIEFYAKAKEGQNTYRSNIRQDVLNAYNLSIRMTSNVTSQYVKPGDVIEYTINVKNESKEIIPNIQIIENIPDQLTVKSVEKGDEKLTELEENNNVIVYTSLKSGEEQKIKISTIVNEAADRTEAEQITNIAAVNVNGNEIAKTGEITHIIEPSNENNSNGGNNQSGSNQNEETKIISGIAWFDKNNNGKKDTDEQLLSNIKVSILNLETNEFVKNSDGNKLEVTTNEKGMYILSNIPKGKYIIIFDFAKDKYKITTYKAEGVLESENSNAMMSELTIQGETNEYVATDVIHVENENISNINIGLNEIQKFDLKLEKYITKMTVQNSKGTVVKEYDNSNIAKLELDAKQLNNTNVIIEYKIKVSNVGEATGYAKKIVDYMPNDMKFNSELNKDWYQNGKNIYTNSLENQPIKAGETKELTLILTKSMNENNVGRMGNVAEIAEDYNELGMKDINSTPNNRVNGENDMATADAIISIKTGGIVFYSIITIVILIALSTVLVPIIKNKNKPKNKSMLDKI